jgi:hypothetical protein
VGSKSKAIVREYKFLLRESSIAPHQIIFTILNEAFRSHGLRYQDAPDLCSLKLHRDMANSVDDPLKTHYRISGTELDDYRASHSGRAPQAAVEIAYPVWIVVGTPAGSGIACRGTTSR